ncbi:MAG TPA: putative toxin-antitoxin system toxin component, PIN family [Candidatus Nanoarchaeia archaeon]|nr:putative toxin-antitoxin system toxin component, PIN family [Candidatus Nanoarchaeia archaeon]
MIKAVLDTNILISALGWDIKQGLILNHCLDNKFKLVISPEILKEIKDVLFRERFEFIDKDKKDEFLMLLVELAEIVIPEKKIDVCRDKEDNKFIELAVTAKADYIVSGDCDLLELKMYSGIKIISSESFLRVLDGE